MFSERISAVYYIWLEAYSDQCWSEHASVEEVQQNRICEHSECFLVMMNREVQIWRTEAFYHRNWLWKIWYVLASSAQSIWKTELWLIAHDVSFSHSTDNATEFCLLNAVCNLTSEQKLLTDFLSVLCQICAIWWQDIFLSHWYLNLQINCL